VSPSPGVTRPAAAVALGAALLYFAALAADGFPWLRLLAKPVPALALAMWVAHRGDDRPARLVAAGLGLSAAGDALLELGHFLPGLFAFLLAHVAYVAGFVASDPRPALGRAVPFAAWGAGVLAVLWPGLGETRGPVVAYVAVIATMMWRAAVRVGSGPVPARAAWLALAGALSFAASDTLIAFDRFHSPLPGVRWPMMALYWLGQWGLAASAVAARRPRSGILTGR
jgi:uncharacterized membrane protein YhhN